MTDLPSDLRTLRAKLQRLAVATGRPFTDNILDDAADELETFRQGKHHQENERLRQQVQAYRDDIEREVSAHITTIETVHSLRRELAEAQRDAARYRWLAEKCADEYGEAERRDHDVVLVWSAPYSKTWRADLDAAIDAAMDTVTVDGGK